MDAAGTEPTLRDLKAPALAQQNIAGGNATFSSNTCAWPCGASSKPNTGSIFSNRDALASRGTRICDCC